MLKNNSYTPNELKALTDVDSQVGSAPMFGQALI